MKSREDPDNDVAKDPRFYLGALYERLNGCGGWVHGGASSNTIEPDAGNPGLSDERMQALERTLTSMRIRW